MREHSNPEVFAEHLRPYLIPIPETKDEAFELLLLLWCADLWKGERQGCGQKTPGPPPGTGRRRK